MDGKPGINHMEWWVKDWDRSGPFYRGLFQRVGWRTLDDRAFSNGSMEIYFKEVPDLNRPDTLGPRHICFQAVSRKMVDEVHSWLVAGRADIIRGPVEMPDYSFGYYTVDFRDPDGFILEVAHTPHMEL